MSIMNPPPVGTKDFGKAGDAAATSDDAATGFISLFKRGLQFWSTLLARIPTLGQKSAAGSLPVVLPSDVQVPTSAPGGMVAISASFSRPANTTAYALGQLVANSTTAASVAPLTLAGIVRAAGEAVRIERIRLVKTGASMTNASFRVHLFSAAPSANVGDGASFNTSGVLQIPTAASWVGSFDVSMSAAGNNASVGIGIPSTGFGVTAVPAAGTSLFALIEARAAYSPVSGETFTLTAEAIRP